MTVASLLWLAPALSASDPAAELSRAAKFFRDGKAHVTRFTQTYTPAGFSHGQTETGSLTLQAPESVRFEYRAPAGKIFTFDGETARFLSPSDHQLVSRRLSESDRATLPLVFLQSPEALGNAFELSMENGPPEEVVLKPRSSGAAVEWIRVVVSPSGAPAALSYESSSGDRTEFRFETFSSRAPLPPADFLLQPPPGTRLEESGP